jgi:hypothetical protein
MATKPAEVVPFVAPEPVTDLKPIRSAAADVVQVAASLTRPRTEADLEAAAAALVSIKTLVVDPAEAVRKDLNKPLAEAKKRQDELIRNTLTVGDTYLPDLEKELRAGIVAYRSREYERAQRKAARQIERLEEKAGAADGPTVVPFVPGGETPKRTVKTADGMVIVSAKLKFTVTNESALPEHCFIRVPNAKLIQGLLEAGQDVPGVTAVYELNTTVRSA